jgi:hypothetical protein
VHNLSSDNTAVKTALKEAQEQQQADAKGREEAAAALALFREEAAAREAKAAGECERMFKLVQQAHEKVRPAGPARRPAAGTTARSPGVCVRTKGRTNPLGGSASVGP